MDFEFETVQDGAEEAAAEEAVEETEAELTENDGTDGVPADISEEAEAAEELQEQLAAVNVERDGALKRAEAAEAALTALKESRSLVEATVASMYGGNLQNLQFDNAFMSALESELDSASPEFRATINKVLKEAKKVVEQNPLKAQRAPEAEAKPAPEQKATAVTAAEKAVIRLQSNQATALLTEMEVRPGLHTQLSRAIVEAAGLEGEITPEFVVEQVKAYKRVNKMKNDDLLVPSGEGQKTRRPPTGSARAATSPSSRQGTTDAEAQEAVDPIKARDNRLAARKSRLAAFTRELAQRGGRVTD